LNENKIVYAGQFEGTCHLSIVAPPADPNAPKPEGSALTPIAGDQLVVSTCTQ